MKRNHGQSTAEYVLIMMLVFGAALVFFNMAKVKLGAYRDRQVNSIHD